MEQPWRPLANGEGAVYLNEHIWLALALLVVPPGAGAHGNLTWGGSAHTPCVRALLVVHV